MLCIYFSYYDDVHAFENITKIKNHHYIMAYFPVPADDGENKLFQIYKRV